MEKKRGFVFGGTFVVDNIKTIDGPLAIDELRNITDTEKSVGGSPANCSIVMRELIGWMPIAAMGRVGDDNEGLLIRRILDIRDIEIHGVQITPKLPTSLTDVFIIESTGDRIYSHYQGANGVWGIHDIKFSSYSRYKMVHIGYPLLMKNMDARDSRFGVTLAKVFSLFQKLGLKTSVDTVTLESDRYPEIFSAILPYVDYVIIDELEAERISGIQIREEKRLVKGSLLEAANKIFEMGSSELVVIHMAEGGYVLNSNGDEWKMPSYQMPDIKSKLGCGDSFAVGILYGLHEDMTMLKTLELANSLAASCLLSPSATGGARSIDKVLDFVQQFDPNTLVF